jgi:hypothetical protein
MPAAITLLTDFGHGDAYVGVLHGVILQIAPDARVIDLCHEVPPQDVQAGAFLLMTSYKYFPKGTVHVGIVDPGVGTQRRIAAVRAGGHTFVGPDNGLLAWAAADAGGIEEAVAVERPEYWLGGGAGPISRTFHGRDIMAPVAAHVATGVALDRLGPSINALMGELFPSVTKTTAGLAGEIVYVDRFGNCVSNLPKARARPGDSVLAGGQEIPVRNAYGEATPGHPLAVVGSAGLLEVAVANGSAAQQLGLRVGDTVLLRGQRCRRMA